MILIGSESIHSFLDEDTSINLQCPMQATLPLSVIVTNGSKMVNRFKCPDFKWIMQGHEFIANLWILKLSVFHIVLMVDWMKMVSLLIFDFNKLEVTFKMAGKSLTLTRSLEEDECKLVTGPVVQKIF